MSTYDFEPDPADFGPEPAHIANPSLRVPYTTPYEANPQYMGNGISKFCMRCNTHRPYAAGGAYLGPKGLKYWVCKLHINPVRDK